MKMKVTEFKAKCAQVVREVATKPYAIELTKHGKVVAVVKAPEPGGKREPGKFFGSLAGTASYVGDIVSPAADARDWEATR
ncbi:MAG: type II toxin-antitoxin system prevent-host-death family antitoxin [Verrucomicrobiota bacterium]